MESSRPPGCPTSKPGSRHSSAIAASHIFSGGIPPTIVRFKAPAVRKKKKTHKPRSRKTMHLKLGHCGDGAGTHTDTEIRRHALPFTICISVIDLLTPPHPLFLLHFHHIPLELISSAPTSPPPIRIHQQSALIQNPTRALVTYFIQKSQRGSQDSSC